MTHRHKGCVRKKKGDTPCGAVSSRVPPVCLGARFPQEVSSLGLRAVWSQADGPAELNVVAGLNSLYELIQLHRQGLRALDDMEVERLRSASDAELLHLSNTRLKVTGMPSPLPVEPQTVHPQTEP